SSRHPSFSRDWSSDVCSSDLFRHILPNLIGPMMVIATLGLGSAVLAEASLSFLGFGVPEPHPSWGNMISGYGRQYLYQAPWMAKIARASRREGVEATVLACLL